MSSPPAGSARDGRFGGSRYASVVALVPGVLIVAFAYTLPSFENWRAMAWSPLPPWVSSDSYLYMTLARLDGVRGDETVNPWYGGTFRKHDVPYFQFDGTLKCFRLLRELTGNEATALVWWQAGLSLLTSVVLLFAFRDLLPSWTRLSALLGLAIFMFIDAQYVLSDLHAVVKPQSVLFVYGLPHSRLFYPQTCVPLVLLFIWTVERWFATEKMYWLISAAVAQFLALLVFPYAVLLCVGAAALAGIWMLVVERQRSSSLGILAVCVVCIAVDTMWVLWRIGGGGHSTPGGLEIDPSGFRWAPIYSYALILSAATLLSRVPWSLRATLVGCGLVVILTPISAVIGARGLAVHLEYLSSLVVGLLAAFVASVLIRDGRRRWPLATTAIASVAIVGVLAAGMAIVFRTIGFWRDANVSNAQLERTLRALRIGTGDLIVEPIRGVKRSDRPAYWETSWIPLVSDAHVLYTSGADLVGTNRQESSERLALFLHLIGETSGSIDQELSRPHATKLQHFLAGFRRELSLESGKREQVLQDLRHELLPRLRSLETGTPARLLGRYRRVIVVDDIRYPVFDLSTLVRHLDVSGETRAGPWRVLIGRARVLPAKE